MCKEFNDKMNAHTEVLRKGQLIMVDAIIKEINDYKYDSASQIKGALASHKERLEGEQYERDAYLDHVTSRGE